MKKVFLMLGMAAFVLASCCNSNEQATCDKAEKCCAKKECCEKKCEKQCTMTEEEKAACKEFKAKWDDFANQTPEVQAELIAKKKACTDAKIAAKKECLAKCTEKLAACEAKFAAFDSLSIADQKALLDSCCINKCCKKKCEKKCDKAEAKCSKEASEQAVQEPAQ